MSFESMLAMIPDEQLHPKLRAQLATFGSLIDGVGRLDEASGTVFVDDASFHKLISTFLSATAADRFVTGLQQRADSRMLSQAPNSGKSTGTLKTLDWSVLTSRVAVLDPQSGKVLNEMGLNFQSTEAEVRAAMQKHFPDYPADLFDPKQLYDAARRFAEGGEMGRTFSINDIWDCLVRNLGFWGAVAAATAVLVITIAFDIALVASGGVLGVVFWATFWPALAVVGTIGVAFDVVVAVVYCLFGG